MFSSVHLGFLAVAVSASVALFICWTRMKYPETVPSRLMNATLVAALACLFVGVGIALDGLGYTWFRSLRFVDYAAMIAVALLAVLALSAPEGAVAAQSDAQPSVGASTQPAKLAAEENSAISYVFHSGRPKHITVVEPPRPEPRFPRGSHPSDHRPAFVRFRPNGMVLMDSHNMTFITDNGSGDFTLGFRERPNVSVLVVRAMPPTPSNFKCVIAEDLRSIRVVFEDDEPEIVALRFDD